MGPALRSMPKAELGCNLKSYRLPDPKPQRVRPFLLNRTTLSASPLNLDVLMAPNNEVSFYQGWGEK